MCLKAWFRPHRDRLACFESAQNEVRRLDFAGKGWADIDAYRQYQRRNAFGLDRDLKLHRIMPQVFYDSDVASGCLTLPIASPDTWGVSLENPLASVTEPDSVTEGTIHLGSTVSRFHALCWTRKAEPTEEDWKSFSHGKPAVRITTTIGKLLDRVMERSDSAYMHRHWLVDVDYKDTRLVQQMRTPSEVYRRMQSDGALLALSVAIVETRFCDEGEMRYLFDNGVLPKWSVATYDDTGQVPLVRVPFDWNGFVEREVQHP
jgi:hypothetical protein